MKMRYAAIDVETTSLDPDRGQVLELACVVETDWTTPVDELPTFRALVNPGEIRGDVRALAMNLQLINELARAPRTDLDGCIIDLSGFLDRYFPNRSLPGAAVTIAGKNFGAFDYRFLSRSDAWNLIRHKHRFIDVGSMWWNPKVDDCLPDLGTCRERAGLYLSARPQHDAVSDCCSVIECIRGRYRD